MSTEPRNAQPPRLAAAPSDPEAAGEASLTIGDLARQTGLTAERLRMWEARYGFPEAGRLPSGHRRYRPADVDAVRLVTDLQERGVRLEQAIAQATAATTPAPDAIFAHLRRRFPALHAYRLRKKTLMALSWAIEDECCAQAQRPMLFGAFQYARYYEPSRSRWEELARVASSTVVLADFDETAVDAPDRGPALVKLAEDSPMLREWSVVCEAPDFPAALAAWELPGQSGVPDSQRLFEAVWTIDPVAVREAARVCAVVAQRAGYAPAPALLYELASSPTARAGDLAAITTLFNRVVAYVDRFSDAP